MKSAGVLGLAALAVCCGGGAAPSSRPAAAVGAAAPVPATFASGDARLAFTLDLPAGTGPFPAVVAGHGSGRVTRDQLAWLASEFTRLGFAVLRFDKRGVGESTGTFVFVGVRDSPEVFPQLASDIAAGVRFLRTRSEIDPRRIGLAGVSQAGWILPEAARELGGVAFLVLLSGPVCTVGQEVYYSDLVENNTSRPLSEADALLPGYHGADGYDPLPVLQALNTPALWVLGLEDRSIPVQHTLANLRRLKLAGRPFEWRTYEGLGHSLAPAVWNDIGPWIQQFR
jgi:pimeloyl-ACP methyl ester carboxylesterase